MVDLPISPMLQPPGSGPERPNIAIISFETEQIPIDNKPGEFREVDKVTWAKKGGNGTMITESVARYRKHDPMMWAFIQAPYERWKQGQEEPTEGTPLSVWPGITRAQADFFKTLHLRTVEDIAEANDATMDRMGMGARALREKARNFMTAKKGSAIMAAELIQRDDKIEALEATVKDLQASIASLTAGMKQRERPGKINE